MKALDEREDNLLDLVAEGGATGEKVRARLAGINAQRTRLQEQDEDLTPALITGSDLIYAALEVTDDPHELYANTSDEARRFLNQACFVRLYVDATTKISDDVLRDPFDALLSRWARLAFGEADVARQRRRDCLVG